MPRTYISDYMWSKISPLLPKERGGKGRPYNSHRPVLEGIIWRLRIGDLWRDVPEEFGSWRTLFTRTAGQISDFKMVIPLLEGKIIDVVIADKGYDSDGIRTIIRSIGAEAVIPYRSNRKQPGNFDKFLSGTRHAVENFFAKLIQFRSAACRYEKTTLSYRGMLTLACILLYGQDFENTA